MSRSVRRATGAGLLAAAVLLTGCAGEQLPDIDTGQAQAELTGPSVVGFMEAANVREVVLVMPDGSQRVFVVREQDVNRIGIGHLASHVGFTDIGFEVFYDTEDGTHYIVGAQEVAPPT